MYRPPSPQENWEKGRLWFTVTNCVWKQFSINQKKKNPPSKTSLAHVSCHFSSPNVGACDSFPLRNWEEWDITFLTLVHSISTIKNVLTSPWRWFSLSRNKHSTKKINWKPSSGRNLTKDWYINNLSKSQVYVTHSFWVIFHAPLQSFVWRRHSVYSFGTQIWPLEINKTICSSLLL